MLGYDKLYTYMFHRSNIWQHSWIWNNLISDYRYTRARDNKNTLHNKQYNTWVTFANDYGRVIANVDHLRWIFVVHSLQLGIKFCILDFVLAEKIMKGARIGVKLLETFPPCEMSFDLRSSGMYTGTCRRFGANLSHPHLPYYYKICKYINMDIYDLCY
jgi:hypothetical protein